MADSISHGWRRKLPTHVLVSYTRYLKSYQQISHSLSYRMGIFIPPPNHILKLSVRNSVVPVYKGTSHFRGWPSLEVSQLYNSLLLVASLLEKTYPPEFLLCPTLPPYCSGLAKTDFFFPFEASSLLIHKVKNYIMFKSATNKALGISDA